MKNLHNYKTVLILLFVVVVNLIVAILVWQLDLFVHGDLYSYGLIYNHDWANPYWHQTAVLWAFWGGATALAAAAIVPHYWHSQKVTNLSTWTGFFLPLLALIYEGFTIFFFDQKNSIVWNILSSYGLTFDEEWVTTCTLFSITSIALMIVAFGALIIPAVRAVAYKLRLIRD